MMRKLRAAVLVAPLLLSLDVINAFITAQQPINKKLFVQSNGALRAEKNFNVELNEFFKSPVPENIKDYVALRSDASKEATDFLKTVVSPPGDPGVPRPLSTVVFASIPTGLVWYGYYKFCVEEELLAMELEAGKMPRGFGGYGTLGPFCYGLLLGPVAELFHLPGGVNWSALGIIFIYYTQFLLYDRVNALYEEEGLEQPLTVWWCLPIFFPFNLVVGLRQVHFLSQYFYRKRGDGEIAPSDPIAEFFPFITADKFTWQEFFVKPRLWCSLLKDSEDIPEGDLPYFVREFLKIGTTK